MLMLLLLFIDYDDGGGEKWVCWQKKVLTNMDDHQPQHQPRQGLQLLVDLCDNGDWEEYKPNSYQSSIMVILIC